MYSIIPQPWDKSRKGFRTRAVVSDHYNIYCNNYFLFKALWFVGNHRGRL